MLTPLTALSAIDGRYARTAAKLSPYFSECALIRYRVAMQVEYLIHFAPVACGRTLSQGNKLELRKLASLSEEDAQIIKDIETKGWGDIKATNHDVVAALTWLRQQVKGSPLTDLATWVHFGLTSEDCNNVAYACMLRDGICDVLYPEMLNLMQKIELLAVKYARISMLARTHGQPATPTTLGKEFRVFSSRLRLQLDRLRNFKLLVKLNGASGNYAAHVAAFPAIDWPAFSNEFVMSHNDDYDGPACFVHNPITTQIEPHDTYAELFGIIMQFNTILVGFCQDMWRYISDEYLVQKAVAGEVGSSAMPHKVNPIDFENAEGNLLFANAILGFFAQKLPISRLQRDLTDSTVERNFGLALGHCLHGYLSLNKGLGKISANEKHIREHLLAHPEVLAEAYQTILRRAGVPDAYNKLKDITRGQEITFGHLQEFVRLAEISEQIRSELAVLTPETYIGLAAELASVT